VVDIETLSIETPAGPVTARLHPGGTNSRFALLAPGAGATLDQPFLVRLAEELAEAGFAALRFNFPYRERNASRPDRPPVLEATWSAAIDFARGGWAPGFLAVGGRSMGGRIASMVVAAGVPVSALLLLAYPLRAPSGGQPRTAHLPSIPVPTIFVSGTRDPLAPIEDLRDAVKLVPAARLVELPGADHSFAAPKSANPGTAELQAIARRAVVEWLSTAAETAP
jgi:predicted alpha/beta-hydrolase family hydrolase